MPKGAFLCAEPGVNLNVAFTKKFSAGLFGGEGFILQDLSGVGMAFWRSMVTKSLKICSRERCLK